MLSIMRKCIMVKIIMAKRQKMRQQFQNIAETEEISIRHLWLTEMDALAFY